MNTEKLFSILKSILLETSLPIRKDTLISHLEGTNVIPYIAHHGTLHSLGITKEDVTSFLFFLNANGIITMNPINGTILHHQIHHIQWSPLLQAHFHTMRINMPLLQKLKQKRNELARQHKLKPYHICQNTFLEWLSLVQPTTLKQLYQKLPMANGLIAEAFLLHFIDVIRETKGKSSLSTLLNRLNHLRSYIVIHQFQKGTPIQEIAQNLGIPTDEVVAILSSSPSLTLSHLPISFNETSSESSSKDLENKLTTNTFSIQQKTNSKTQPIHCSLH